VAEQPHERVGHAWVGARALDDHTKAVGYILNGLVALLFALAVWRLTGSFVGWAALFLPGSALVLLGLYHSLKR
jgi:hypothetical protein